MDTHENIKYLRESLGMTQDELAEMVGYRDRSSIAKVEAGKVDLTQSKIAAFASALSVSPAKLMGIGDPIIEAEETVQIHFIGDVAAGYDRLAVDEYETLEVPKSWLRGRPASNYFAMRVSGNSMYPEYKNGDEVFCIATNEMGGSGKIGVIIYNSEEATLKRLVYKQGEDWLDLVPVNPEYMTKRIEGADLELCRVIGKPLRLIRNVAEK